MECQKHPGKEMNEICGNEPRCSECYVEQMFSEPMPRKWSRERVWYNPEHGEQQGWHSEVMPPGPIRP